jgi:hypothetical protein
MNLIEKAEQTPLSIDEIKKMLGDDNNRCKVILYNDLAKFETLDQLIPNYRDAAIILLEIEGPNAPKVGHWVALLNHDSHFEHFDSYGLDPDEELGLTHEQPYITKLIQNSKIRVESSQAKLQARREAMNTCGRWCVVRVRFPDLEKKEFVQFIREVHNVPDVAATLLTYLLVS